jgi:hypothetical protein
VIIINIVKTMPGMDRMNLVEKFSILIVLSLILLTIGCTTTQKQIPGQEQTPEGTLNNYVRALNDRDSKEVHRMLSKSLQDQINHEIATTDHDPVQDALYGLDRQGATINSVEMLNVTTSGNTAQVEIDFFWHYPPGEPHRESRQVATMVKENGTWKFQNFFPFNDSESVPSRL